MFSKPARGVCVAALLFAACVPPSVGKLIGKGDDGLSKPSDTIRTGLVSDEMLEAKPYGFRVSWVRWDSEFRGTELRIGDRIIGVDGTRYTLATRPTGGGIGVGQWNEPSVWKKRGAGDGTKITLTVWRKGKVFDVSAKLRAERFYHGKDGKRALAPGGPDPLFQKDGFDSAWQSWYEELVKRESYVLDGGWQRGSFNNRQLLAEQRDDKKRVDLLVSKYPGKFAETVAADWKRVRDVLLGKEHRITAKGLEYRSLGEKRAKQIAQAATSARKAFLARFRSETIPPFPALDPIEGDLGAVAGKVVVLPVMGSRSWISEAGHGYLYAGDSRQGLYFIDSRGPEMNKALNAMYRYQQVVSPKIAETYAIIGRIEPQPSMRVVGSQAYAGLSVKPIGVTIGNAMFVDLTKGGKEATFAGEDALPRPGAVAVRDDATPKQVMQAYVEALESANKDAWQKLYADWNLSIYSGVGRVSYDPHYWMGVNDSDWIRARRLILDKVYAINVVDVGLMETVLQGNEFPGAPKIEQVTVELEHVGKFDEGYRPVKDVNVNRMWTLQRRDGGPWRIVTRRSI